MKTKLTDIHKKLSDNNKLKEIGSVNMLPLLEKFDDFKIYIGRINYLHSEVLKNIKIYSLYTRYDGSNIYGDFIMCYVNSYYTQILGVLKVNQSQTNINFKPISGDGMHVFLHNMKNELKTVYENECGYSEEYVISEDYNTIKTFCHRKAVNLKYIRIDDILYTVSPKINDFNIREITLKSTIDNKEIVFDDVTKLKFDIMDNI